jgi:hypothetical protein
MTERKIVPWPDDQWIEMKAAWEDYCSYMGTSPSPQSLGDFASYQERLVAFSQGWSRARGLGCT